MLKFVTKRDGQVQEFMPHKLNQWAIWAGEKLIGRVDWSGVVLDAIRGVGDTIYSQDLQERLIKACLTRKDWPHNLMAGKLYCAIIRKEIFDLKFPTVKDQFDNLRNKGYMIEFPYSDEEYEIINTIIDHSRDFDLAYQQVKQLRNKYSIQDKLNKIYFETPQFVYMRMAAHLAAYEPVESRLTHLKNYYDHFSFNRINCPTPNYNNLGTPHRGYSSCCLFTVADNADSLAIGDHIAYKMTLMSAGIGGYIDTRSSGDSVRGGSIVHNGKLPYYTALAGAVKANTQGGRGGACTMYYTAFDPEAATIVRLQNPRSTEASKNRDIHFAMMTNRLVARKVRDKESIFTFNSYTAPDLHKAFFSADQDHFEKLYEKYEKDDSFKKNYVDATELIALGLMQQSFEVGTNYWFDAGEANRHTPFKDTIYSSNLCVAPETKVLTDEGYKVISTLEGLRVNVWNGKEFTPVTVKKTGVNKKLMRITTRKGEPLECTHYHKFFIHVPNNDLEVETRAIYLMPGDRLIKSNIPQNFRLDNDTDDDFDVVTKVEKLDGLSDTYCFIEPKEHKAVFNGILTGQCTETVIPTKPYYSMLDLYSDEIHEDGEVGMCNLACVVEPNIENDEVYESACLYSLKMIDRCIELSDYPLAHIGATAKARLNAGVGLVGAATTLARKGLKYNTLEGRNQIHLMAERHAYFCIKSSLKLGIEYGNAPWIHKTKWPEGWLPIDTYKKTVDSLVSVGLNYDWETLRKDIIKNKGIRNSSIILHPPTESSSKASGLPNSWYPIRELAMKKSDLSNIIEWCAMDSDLLINDYQVAWDIDTIDMIKVYSIIQKFTDQSISADLYSDRTKNIELSASEMVKIFLTMVKYGMKSRYYQNTRTSSSSNDNVEKGCGSGGCTL